MRTPTAEQVREAALDSGLFTKRAFVPIRLWAGETWTQECDPLYIDSDGYRMFLLLVAEAIAVNVDRRGLCNCRDLWCGTD